MAFKSISNYRHGDVSQLGVLLINLGTPTAPTPTAVRRFLREFLSDPRVIEIPRPLWQLILYLFVLPLRPRKVALAYKKIWTSEGSPLLVETLKQVSALNTELKQNPIATHDPIIVAAAMCYGTPKIADLIELFEKKNTRRLLIVPMYPQYSATTTAAAFDTLTKTLHHHRWLPELRFVNNYHDHPLYIKACAEQILSIRNHHDKHKLLFSFHGLPKRNLLKGDPYHCQCYTTARLIAEKLKLADSDWMLTFQSRFGKAEWLKPYTDETLRLLPDQGSREVDVFCPGFAVDCLETLEEIAIQNKEIFMAAGGNSFRYIPALNSNPSHIKFLAHLIQEHTQNWHDTNNDETRRVSRERALALGATTQTPSQ